MRQRERTYVVGCLDSLWAGRTCGCGARHAASGHGHHHGFGRLVGYVHYQSSALIGDNEHALHHIATRYRHLGLHHGSAVDALLTHARRCSWIVPLVAGRQPPTTAAAAPAIGKHHTEWVHHGTSRAVQPDSNALPCHLHSFQHPLFALGLA